MGEAGSWNVGSADGGRGIGSDVVGGSPAASRVTGRRLGPFFFRDAMPPGERGFNYPLGTIEI